MSLGDKMNAMRIKSMRFILWAAEIKKQEKYKGIKTEF